jgi:hypothetical protein
VFLLLILWCSFCAAQDEWQGVDRIVAIGDIHGDYDQMYAVLQMSRVIDEKGRWIADKTHLVQAGDIPDRGPDTAKIIRFFQKLEKQAKKKKGHVHLLIGNHEAMNMTGDLRYVHPGEYSALITSKSTALQNAYYKSTIEWLRQSALPEAVPVFDETFRKNWEAKYPLGYVEHRRIWDKSGRFGKWVRKHNAVIKINDILFAHGGLGPGYATRRISGINEEVVNGLSGPVVEGSIIEDTEGPLWYRGLANNSVETESLHVDSLLKHYGVKHIVIAHTVTEGAIKPRFNGKVIMIDTGMSAHYGSHKASLVIEDGNFRVIHRGTEMAFPFAGEALIAYLEAAMAKETDKTRLANLISKLKAGDSS